ncbi:MAG: hypothetical protein K0R33_3366 [Mycobacterium sp.]|nr:hypothetical protein [Mycobacterium sp.]
MRVPTVAVSVLAAAATALSGLAGAAAASAAPPKCEDVGAVPGPGFTCQIQQTDPAYMLNIIFPSDYPDQKAVVEYVKQTRDGFLNVAKTPDFRGMPYELDTTSVQYSSAVPPRGTQSVVFTTYQNVGGAHPQTFYKAFSWDQAYRKPITFENLFRAGTDPLPVIFPVVQADLASPVCPIPCCPARVWTRPTTRTSPSPTMR